MPYNWITMPIVTCPHCDNQFQLDEYYDYETGDTFDCQTCEKEIHVLELATIIEARVGTKKEE